MGGGQPDHRVCGPIDVTNKIAQYFVSPDDYLSGISLKLGTYRRVMRHRVVFSLSFAADDRLEERGPEPSVGALLFASNVAASGVSDLEYHHFLFPTIVRSKGRMFALTIHSVGAKQGEALTAWLSRVDDRIPGHVRFRARERIAEEYALQARLITSNPVAATTYPPGLLYSPLSSCNMNCTHCISRHSRRRAIRMSESIREDIAAHAKSKQLQWMFTDYSGDIFFADHRNPGELDFILDLGIAIHIDTNGAYLDATAIERIMASSVDALSISVDASRDETYRSIRIGSPPIESTFEHARAVVEARARHGRRKDFRIQLGFTLMRSNVEELPSFIQMAAEAGVDAVATRHVEVYHVEMEAESLINDRARFNSIRATSIKLAKKLKIELHIGEELWHHPSSSGREPCAAPWTSAVVLANGDVMACCVPGSRMGNITTQSLESIWQGEGYRRLRRRVNSLNPPALCRSCPFLTSLNHYTSGDEINASRYARPLLDELMAEGHPQDTPVIANG